MTDNTQELDEILYGHNLDQTPDIYEPENYQHLRQTILDWHNKQVDNYRGIIKMADKYTFDTGEVYYSQKTVNKQVLEIIGEDEQSDDSRDFQFDIRNKLRAEQRNKLKESK